MTSNGTWPNRQRPTMFFNPPGQGPDLRGRGGWAAQLSRTSCTPSSAGTALSAVTSNSGTPITRWRWWSTPATGAVGNPEGCEQADHPLVEPTARCHGAPEVVWLRQSIAKVAAMLQASLDDA